MQIFNPEQLRASYFNPFDASIEQDPRVIAALEAYANCLRAEGYDYKHEKDIEPDLRKRPEAITGGAPVEVLSADAQVALKELQNYERSLAVVAFRCEVTLLEPVVDQVEQEI